MKLKSLILLFILIVFFLPVSSQGTEKDRPVYYRVTRIVDGDTFWIDDGTGKGVKIRLTGIDAPESHSTGRKMKGYFGDEAKEYLAHLIAGKRVRIEYDIERFDKYGRTLAYVYLENGIFVNAQLVRNGFAVVMTTPPNVRYADEFVKLAQKARNQKKGMWKD